MYRKSGSVGPTLREGVGGPSRSKEAAEAVYRKSGSVGPTLIERRRPMSVLYEILRTLGRIEGELVEIRKLNQRVRHLEMWQSWLKGGWAAMMAFYAYLLRGLYGR